MAFPARSTFVGHHRLTILGGTTLLLLGLAGTSNTAQANGFDVCTHNCRYTQLAPALAAAKDGDTIRVGPGVYQGGLTITASIRLRGSGPGSTVIRGGGPVLTIGTLGTAAQPTVEIRGVTITGGVTRTSKRSVLFTGADGVIASGGGIEIPPGPDSPTGFGRGATVSITDSAITGNRVAPTATVPFGAQCQAGPCQFAAAEGGGIDSWGDLTLDRSSVSHNRVGSASGLSDLAWVAEGGAVEHSVGDLVIKNSSFEDNRVSATAPNGQFADSGAIHAAGNTATMNRAAFRHNMATLTAALPDTVGEIHAQAGALHLTNQLTAATIRDSEFSDNSATVTNTVGTADANSGAIHGDLLFTLSGSTFDRNSVDSSTPPGSPGGARGDSGAGEISGDITRTRFTGNSVTVRSAEGNVVTGAGGILFSGTMTRSIIRDNRIVAAAPRGSVALNGAGLLAGDFELTIRRTDITRNTGVAIGRSGAARGGGLFDSPVPDGPPGGDLRLDGGSVTRNVLRASPGVTVSGGGVFSTYPVDLAGTEIARNVPDQCVGC